MYLIDYIDESGTTVKLSDTALVVLLSLLHYDAIIEQSASLSLSLIFTQRYD